MIGKIDTVAVWAILVLTLALSVVLGLITPYALAALGVFLAGDAARRLRADFKPCRGNAVSTVHARAVRAVVDPDEGAFDVEDLLAERQLGEDRDLARVEVRCDVGRMLRRRGVLTPIVHRQSELGLRAGDARQQVSSLGLQPPPRIDGDHGAKPRARESTRLVPVVVGEE